MSNIWNLPPKNNVKLSFNRYFQPIEHESRRFNQFIKIVARRHHLCPINVVSWCTMPNDYKENCWNIIEVLKFY